MHSVRELHDPSHQPWWWRSIGGKWGIGTCKQARGHSAGVQGVVRLQFSSLSNNNVLGACPWIYWNKNDQLDSMWLPNHRDSHTSGTSEYFLWAWLREPNRTIRCISGRYRSLPRLLLSYQIEVYNLKLLHIIALKVHCQQNDIQYLHVSLWNYEFGDILHQKE